MTMYDDSQLELLERDLQRLAEPRDEDELVRRAVRRQLAAKAAPRPRRRLSMRMPLAAAAVAAAAAAIAIVTLCRHVRIRRAGRCGRGRHPPRADGSHIAGERDPPRTGRRRAERRAGRGRVVAGDQPAVRKPCHQGTGRAQREGSDNGTTSFEYDPGTNTITEQPDSSPATPIDPVWKSARSLPAGRPD